MSPPSSPYVNTSSLDYLLSIFRHKNSIVRKVAAFHILTLCEKLGPGKLLSGVKDITDKLLPALAVFIGDSSPETR